MGLKRFAGEVWEARDYYGRRPLTLARYAYAKWRLSGHRRVAPDRLLQTLGVDRDDYAADFARWRPALDEACETGSRYLGWQTGISATAGEALYCVTRALRPGHVIETGGASGISTAFFSAALIDNGSGTLHTIELPHREAAERFSDFGSVYEAGRGPWYAIPEAIERQIGGRLDKIEGDVTVELPRLVDSLPEIGIFLHDDLHHPAHMTWEFNLVWPRLSPGGVVFCDDAEWAWLRFARSRGSSGVETVNGTGAIRKPLEGAPQAGSPLRSPAA